MFRRMAMSAGVLLAAGAAQAAVITWGPVMDYASSSDVATEGTLVEAINACGAGCMESPLINGVQFAASTNLMGSDACSTFLFSDTGDTGYNDLLNTLDYGSGQFPVGGGLLDLGKEYFIQIWYVDERSSSAGDRSMAFGDGNGNLSAWVDDQYVTGTFTADGASQIITVQGYNNSDGSGATTHVTAYQLREAGSPQPTLSTTAGGTVSGSFSVTVDFSETVFGLEAGDFAVTNGAASGVSGAGADWSVTITPTSNGDVIVTLPAGSVTDIDGHSNIVGNAVMTTYVAPGDDQPVPTLSTATNDVVGDYSVQVDFSEAVTGLQVSDFVITGGTLSDLSGSGASYSVVVSPTIGGNVTLSLPQNSVTDLDGDTLQNVASAPLVVVSYLSVTVSSLADLKTYLPQDNIHCVMTPGTYTITGADVTAGLYNDATLLLGRNHKILLKFAGDNSTYDFTGVTLEVESDVWMQDYGNNGVYQIETTGNGNVLKNLTMVDVGTVDDDPADGCVNIVMDGRDNRIEGFHMTIKGSYPYGYGDCFGKGGGPVISHNKHSAFLIRGESNHAKNCTLIHRSYGHGLFMQAASNPIIEGCYVEGEMRSTDDMLAEEGTGSPADQVDFMTTWGYRLPPGYMKSLAEAGIRAYNAGETLIDGVEYDRGTSNPTIIDNTIVNMRVGVTLTHASGTKYVSGCTAIGTERGYAIGSGIIENCSADVQFGPALGVDYDSDSGVVADITIVPYEGSHTNGSRHIAYIFGSDHNLTFRGAIQNPDQTLEVNVGGDLRIESSTNVVENRPADDIIINNYTGYPLILDDNNSGNDGHSCGTITDDGTGNNFAATPWSVTSNITFYGKATQSSTSHDGIASLAIDQHASGTWSDGSVTHTGNEAQPWWRIDLEGAYAMSDIRIWGRTDACCSDRLSNYDVTILDSGGLPVWSTYQAGSPNPMVSLSPGSVTGQYVVVQLRGTDPLSLAEIEIFGTSVQREAEAIAHWPLDEGAGSVAHDMSGNGFDGTVVNAAWVPDQLGGALDFNGSDSVVDLPAAAFASIDNEISIAMWVFGSPRQPRDDSLFGAFDASSNRVLNIHLPWSNTNVYWDAGYGGGGHDRISYPAGTEDHYKGRWNHWVFTKNAAVGEMKIYLNGVPWKRSGMGRARVMSGVTGATIGAQGPNAYVYDGMIGDVKLFDLALTDDEVGDLYQAGDLHVPVFEQSSVVSNDVLQILFSGTIGQHYRVECTQSLTNAESWLAVTDIVSVGSSPVPISLPTTNDACFYRLRWILD